jgi:hypothetical protein
MCAFTAAVKAKLAASALLSSDSGGTEAGAAAATAAAAAAAKVTGLRLVPDGVWLQSDDDVRSLKPGDGVEVTLKST